MSKDGNIRAGRPFVFEEGGAVSLEGVPVAPEASSEHFVKYDVLAVGPYNLMIGRDQDGEETGDFAFIDSRNGHKEFLGQDPGDRAFFQALQTGEDLRNQS